MDNNWYRINGGVTLGAFTFIFTLAQAGRLSLQLLWTEELQSGKKRRGENYMMAEGRGCVERWGLENLTGLLSWPGNSTSPLMKARLEQSM